MKEFADDIARWLDGKLVSALHGAWLYRLRRTVKNRRPWIAGVGVAAAVATAVWITSPQMSPRVKATALTRLPGMELYPSLSPDGQHVVFSWNVFPEGQFDLYVQAVSGSDPVRLTNDLHDDLSPGWSSDGKTIAFIRRHDTRGSGTVFIIPPTANGRRL